MAAQGGTVSHYYILVIRIFFYFMSLFRHSVWFSFSVKQFPSAEFGICHIQLLIADKNRTAEGLSEKKRVYNRLFYEKVYPIILD